MDKAEFIIPETRLAMLEFSQQLSMAVEITSRARNNSGLLAKENDTIRASDLKLRANIG